MKARENEGIEIGSLADFSFDDPETQDFFGIKGSSVKEAPIEKVVKGVKKDDKVVIDDDEDGDDKGATTKIEDKNRKEDRTANNREEDKDEEIDDDDFFQDTDKKKDPKVNGEVKRGKREENDEEGNEDTRKKGKDDKEKDKKVGQDTDIDGGEDDGEDEFDNEEFLGNLAIEMKDKGFLSNVELPKDKKLTEDQFIELQDAEIEARVQETFESFFEEMDDDGKRFLKFKKDGGRTADFITSFIPGLNIEELDEANEAQVQAVLRYYLSNIERKDAEEVEDRIKWLKEGGKEKAYATKYFTSIKKDEEKAKKALIDAQANAAKEKDDSAKEFNAELKEVLSKTEKIGSFPISKADQRDLDAYITKPTIKVGKNKYVPAFQAAIAKIFGAETKVQKQRLILLAKLVRDDFDVSSVEKEAKTEKVKEARSTLTKSKLGIKANTTGNYARKTLADYFPDDGKG